MSFNVSYITNDELRIKDNGGITRKVNMHEGTSEPSDGLEMNVEGMSSALIEIRGYASGSSTLMRFEGKASGQWGDLRGKNLNNGKVTSETNRIGRFLFNVAGLEAVRVNVVEVSDASITVAGTASTVPVSIDDDYLGDRHVFEAETSAAVLASLPYMKYDQPYINLKVLDSQGMIYIEIQEQKKIGESPETIESFYANNETYKFDVRGRERIRLRHRAGYRGSDTVSIKPIRIAVWGSEE